MWVEKTKKGFRLYDRYKDVSGKIHKISVPLEKNTAQARRKASEELQQKIADKSMLVSEISLKQLLERYLSKISVKNSTLVNYRVSLKCFLDIVGDIPVSSITAPYIKRKLSESDKSPKTLNRYLMLFQSFCAWSVDQGYMESIPQIRRFKDKSAKQDPSQEYLEADELQHILDQLVGTMEYYIVKFLALTGMRFGETIALTWNDIDDRYIHVTKAYKTENGVSTPKTASSIRDIYIQPELKKLLQEYKSWRLEYMMAYNIRSDLLFFNRNGNYIANESLRLKLYKLDCPKHLHPHIFRHTHTALLAEQGLSLETIARRLGHIDSNITKKIYYHVTEKTKIRDENALDKINIL